MHSFNMTMINEHETATHQAMINEYEYAIHCAATHIADLHQVIQYMETHLNEIRSNVELSGERFTEAELQDLFEHFS